MIGDLYPDGNISVLSKGRHASRGRLYKHAGVDRPHHQLQLAGVCQREHSEIIDHPAQPQHFVVHLGQFALARLHEAVHHGLDIASHDAEWRPQFMGHVGDYLPP
jgi:hypothetical protein